MEVALILTAALIGFSFSNTFMCTAITFSISLGKGLRTSLAFLGGRFLGILVLGMILALFGFFIEIDTQLMLYIFGAMTIVFGILILFSPTISSRLRILKNCEMGECSDCDDHEDSTDHDCKSCPSSDNCGSSKIHGEIGSNKKRVDSWIASRLGAFGILGILILGGVRGATPCLKFMLLLPLIITLPFLEYVAITSTYALSSSVYTVIGISIAEVFRNISPDRFKRYLVRSGAISMVLIGIYFLYKAWNYSCQNGM